MRERKRISRRFQNPASSADFPYVLRFVISVENRSVAEKILTERAGRFQHGGRFVQRRELKKATGTAMSPPPVVFFSGSQDFKLFVTQRERFKKRANHIIGYPELSGREQFQTGGQVLHVVCFNRVEQNGIAGYGERPANPL